MATTASRKNAAFLKQLGADQVINYKEEDFVKTLEPVDVVFDTLGGEKQEKSYRSLKKGERLVSIAGVPDETTASDYRVKADYVFMDPDGEQLAKIAQLLKREEIKQVVGYTFPLKEIQQAHELSETGHARGKIVLTM